MRRRSSCLSMEGWSSGHAPGGAGGRARELTDWVLLDELLLVELVEERAQHARGTWSVPGETPAASFISTN
jgi:hypothetical protein